MVSLVSRAWDSAERWFSGVGQVSDIDLKVDAVQHSCLNRQTPIAAKTSSKLTFSPIRLLWWVSLFAGTRAQQPGPFPAQFELFTLDGSNGFVIPGEQSGDWFGSAVSGGGDVNGDGFDDAIILAYYVTFSGGGRYGKVYVIFGKTNNEINSTFKLSELNGKNGFHINGDKNNLFSEGGSVSISKDLNGDKLSDILIGSPKTRTTNGIENGRVYIIFGRENFENNGTFNINELDGSNGFVINGEIDEQRLGYFVSPAGDVNEDGIRDFLIGSRKEGYLIFGSQNIGNSGVFNLTNLNGNNGIKLICSSQNINYCGKISYAGDFNGDGSDDLIMSNYKERKIFIIFGGKNINVNGTIELDSLYPPYGIIINGQQTSIGEDFALAGDINNDGFSDILTGNRIKSYLILGNSIIEQNSTIDLINYNGFIEFLHAGSSSFSCSAAGDINGDSIDDFLIGSSSGSPLLPNPIPIVRTGAGNVYVIYGGTNNRFNKSVDFSNINNLNGFVINGEYLFDQIGDTLSVAGDFNGDGIDDIIIGAPRSRTHPKEQPAGKVYIFFGRKSTAQLINTPKAVTPNSEQAEASVNPKDPAMEKSIIFLNTSLLENWKTKLSSNQTITSVIQFAPASQTPLYVGIALAVFGVFCGVFGMVFYYKSRMRDGSQNRDGNENNYENLAQINPQMHSARNNNYDLIAIAKKPTNYKDWPEEDPMHSPADYDQVRMSQLNRSADQYIENNAPNQELPQEAV